MPKRWRTPQFAPGCTLCTTYGKVRVSSHHNVMQLLPISPLACLRMCPYPPLVSRRRPPASCFFPCRDGNPRTSVESSRTSHARSCGGRLTAAGRTAMANTIHTTGQHGQHGGNTLWSGQHAQDGLTKARREVSFLGLGGGRLRAGGSTHGGMRSGLRFGLV